MKQFIRLSLLILIILGGGSCGKKTNTTISKSDKEEIVQSKFAKQYPEFNPKVLQNYFKSQIENDSILLPYYSANEYSLIWTNDTLNTSRLYTLISVLEDTTSHGLISDYFGSRIIASMTDSINSGLFAENMEVLYAKISDLEKLSTQAFIKYIVGMSHGFLNPKDLYGKNYAIQTALPDSLYYEKLYKDIAKDPIALIHEVQPKDEVYLKMQEAYKDLEAKKDIELPKIESKGDNFSYKLGDKNRNITAIAKRLSITGEFIPDSAIVDDIHYELDDRLLQAVNTFRRKNSYPEEAEIGNITIQALNRPLGYYQEKIRANMERYRWKRKKTSEEKHIEVNVAAFKLFATSASDSSLVMRVCVGTLRNKTPLLESNLGYINLNPVWNVPTSIARGEISVLQKKDETYLKRHNMKLYKGGKEVDPSTIDWSTVNPSKFGYVVRQNSGGGNALGRIKFMFNNDFSVYLHDTPSKKAFNYKNRAVSHGCVRVQQPLDLAFFCTSPATELYKDQIRYSIGNTPVSAEGKALVQAGQLKKLSDIINIDTENKISLAIDYNTVYLQPDDKDLYFADDVYGYDEILLKALSL